MSARVRARLFVFLLICATVGAAAADVHGDFLAEPLAVLIDVQEKDSVIPKVGVLVPLDDVGQLQWSVEGNRDGGVRTEAIEAVELSTAASLKFGGGVFTDVQSTTCCARGVEACRGVIWERDLG